MQLKPQYEVNEIENLRDMLEQSVRQFGEKDAFLVKDPAGNYRGVSYKRFSEDVNALGAALADLGLENSFIAVMGENRYEWCVSYLAVANHVGVIVPTDKELPVSEKGNLLSRSGAAAVIFSGKYADELRSISRSVQTVGYYIDMDLEEDADGFLSYQRLLERGRKIISEGRFDPSGHHIENDKLGILLFTSGTMDLAKGVMLSHANICSNLMAVCRTVYAGSDDLSLSILPIHHTYECTVGFLAMIYRGATIAFNEGLKQILKNFKEARPTFLITVPLILESVYRKIWEQAGKKKGMKTILRIAMFAGEALYNILGIDIRRRLFHTIHETFGGRLRLIMTGAAAISPEVSKGFRSFGISVLQGYGLTECAPLVTGNRDDAFRDDSVGLPIPGVEVRIENPDENGIGEIVVKGGNVMLGYYKNEKATESCLKDGWFHTGDLGRVDRSGFYYITGRQKNVIVTKNGKNIFPEEVEAYINKSPFVLESMVTGDFDSESGETHVNAHIFPNFDEIKDRLKLVNINKDELLRIFSEVVKNVNKDMPLYKRISTFTIRDVEFAKTTTKKIKRYAVKGG